MDPQETIMRVIAAILEVRDKCASRYIHDFTTYLVKHGVIVSHDPGKDSQQTAGYSYDKVLNDSGTVIANNVLHIAPIQKSDEKFFAAHKASNLKMHGPWAAAFSKFSNNTILVKLGFGETIPDLVDSLLHETGHVLRKRLRKITRESHNRKQEMAEEADMRDLQEDIWHHYGGDDYIRIRNEAMAQVLAKQQRRFGYYTLDNYGDWLDVIDSFLGKPGNEHMRECRIHCFAQLVNLAVLRKHHHHLYDQGRIGIMEGLHKRHGL